MPEASSDELDMRAAHLKADGHDEEFVERHRAMAARAIELLIQRRQRSAELSALHAIAGRLSALPDLGSLLQEIVDQARLLLRVDLGVDPVQWTLSQAASVA
ncbi:hypothetical protein [Rhodococcus indonesiensis]